MSAGASGVVVSPAMMARSRKRRSASRLCRGQPEGRARRRSPRHRLAEVQATTCRHNSSACLSEAATTFLGAAPGRRCPRAAKCPGTAAGSPASGEVLLIEVLVVVVLLLILLLLVSFFLSSSSSSSSLPPPSSSSSLPPPPLLLLLPLLSSNHEAPIGCRRPPPRRTGRSATARCCKAMHLHEHAHFKQRGGRLGLPLKSSFRAHVHHAAHRRNPAVTRKLRLRLFVGFHACLAGAVGS